MNLGKTHWSCFLCENEAGLFSEKFPQKALPAFWKKSKKLKDVLKKRYGYSGKKVKKCKTPLKSVADLLGKK